jgi:hypothetical protein
VVLHDRVLPLPGFTCTFRRSQLVALAADDIDVIGGGVVVQLHHPKIDEEVDGRRVGLPARDAAAHEPVVRPIDRHGNVDRQRPTEQPAALRWRLSSSAGRTTQVSTPTVTLATACARGRRPRRRWRR